MKTILLLTLVLLVAVSLSSTTWTINQDGTGDFINIQDGIDASAHGDTVLVYPGTYFENIDFSGKNIVLTSLQIIEGDHSYTSSTIIDGNQSGFAVKIDNQEDNTTIFNGFTIQNSFERALWIINSSPQLKNLIVKENKISGGIALSNSNSYLENVTVTNNHCLSMGGGVAISGNSDPTFSVDNKCSIYNNTVAYAADIGIHPNQSLPVHVVVDTFTVLAPDWNHITQTPVLTLSIDNQWLQQVESDLYVSPDGDDSNSGLTPSEPLKCVQWALTKIKADSLNHRTVHLAPGIYSPAASGQLFPLNLRSYVTIKGAGRDYTFLEEPFVVPPNWYTAVAYAVGVTEIGIKDLTIRNVVAPIIPNSNQAIRLTQYLAPDIKINAHISGIRMENCVNAGIVFDSNGDFTITDSEFRNNSGLRMLYISGRGNDPAEHGNATINNVVAVDNYPFYTDGSAYSARIEVSRINNIHFSNNLIVNNTFHSGEFSPMSHVSLWAHNNLNITNNVLADNITVGSIPGGSLALGGGCNIDIVNSIIYGNSQYVFITNPSYNQPTTVNISHSLIEGGTNPATIHVAGEPGYGVEFNWGDGILDLPPQFLGEVETGYDLSDILYYQPSAFSPYIDAGRPDTTGLNLPPYDLLHNQRIWDGLGDGLAVIDMGCFEYEAPEYVTIEDYLFKPPAKISAMNYPNPFNPETTISFSLEMGELVKLEIFNIRGQRVKTLVNEYLPLGDHKVRWNGRDDRNNPVSSGVYFYRITAGEQTEQKKMLMMK